MGKRAFEWGATVRDKITGFQGTVIGFTTYVTGCDQFLVQPPVKDDGAWQNSHWFDVDRLELVETARSRHKVSVRGADVPAPIK